MVHDEHHDSGHGFVIGIFVLIMFMMFLWFWGLPAAQRGFDVQVPDKINVDVNVEEQQPQ